MTAPATDKGLSEADRALLASCGFLVNRHVFGASRIIAPESAVSALLAAARREGGIASRDHDHSTEKATPKSAATGREPGRVFTICEADLAALVTHAATASNAAADDSKRREREAWAQFDAVVDRVKAQPADITDADFELTPADAAKIDAAWERHKAAGSTDQ